MKTEFGKFAKVLKVVRSSDLEYEMLVDSDCRTVEFTMKTVGDTTNEFVTFAKMIDLVKASVLAYQMFAIEINIVKASVLEYQMFVDADHGIVEFAIKNGDNMSNEFVTFAKVMSVVKASELDYEMYVDADCGIVEFSIQESGYCYPQFTVETREEGIQYSVQYRPWESKTLDADEFILALGDSSSTTED